MNKTSIGLDENVAGLLCYLLAWISGFIFILIEQENKFVRFHAMQSIIVSVVLTIILFVTSWIPVLGQIIWGVCFILWVVLMVKAYQGVTYKLPWAGNMAEKWVG
ncbi:DUF4870 domain-containing protein [Chloroflexota bacterium]